MLHYRTLKSQRTTRRRLRNQAMKRTRIKFKNLSHSLNQATNCNEEDTDIISNTMAMMLTAFAPGSLPLQRSGTIKSTKTNVVITTIIVVMMSLSCWIEQINATDCISSQCNCVWKAGKFAADCAWTNLSDLPERNTTQPPSNLDIQSLNLTGNAIVRLHRARFVELQYTNVQKIYITSNQLESIDEGAFQRLVGLVELDASVNRLASLPSNVTLADAPNLRIVSFAHNQLISLPAMAFATVTNLLQLSLSANKIEFIHALAFHGLHHLNVLHLDSNHLSHMDSRTDDWMRPLIRLHSIALANNPWSCDCHSRALRRYLDRPHHASATNHNSIRNPNSTSPRSSSVPLIALLDKPYCNMSSIVTALSPESTSQAMTDESTLKLWQDLPSEQFECPPRDVISVDATAQFASFYSHRTMDGEIVSSNEISQQMAPQNTSVKGKRLHASIMELTPDELLELVCAFKLDADSDTSAVEIEWTFDGVRIVPDSINGAIIATHNVQCADMSFSLLVKEEKPPQIDQQSYPPSDELKQQCRNNSTTTEPDQVIISRLTLATQARDNKQQRTGEHAIICSAHNPMGQLALEMPIIVSDSERARTAQRQRAKMRQSYKTHLAQLAIINGNGAALDASMKSKSIDQWDGESGISSDATSISKHGSSHVRSNQLAASQLSDDTRPSADANDQQQVHWLSQLSGQLYSLVTRAWPTSWSPSSSPSDHAPGSLLISTLFLGIVSGALGVLVAIELATGAWRRLRRQHHLVVDSTALVCAAESTVSSASSSSASSNTSSSCVKNTSKLNINQDGEQQQHVAHKNKLSTMHYSEQQHQDHAALACAAIQRHLVPTNVELTLDQDNSSSMANSMRSSVSPCSTSGSLCVRGGGDGGLSAHLTHAPCGPHLHGTFSSALSSDMCSNIVDDTGITMLDTNTNLHGVIYNDRAQQPTVSGANANAGVNRELQNTGSGQARYLYVSNDNARALMSGNAFSYSLQRPQRRASQHNTTNTNANVRLLLNATNFDGVEVASSVDSGAPPSAASDVNTGTNQCHPMHELDVYNLARTYELTNSGDGTTGCAAQSRVLRRSGSVDFQTPRADSTFQQNTHSKVQVPVKNTCELTTPYGQLLPPNDGQSMWSNWLNISGPSADFAHQHRHYQRPTCMPIDSTNVSHYGREHEQHNAASPASSGSSVPSSSALSSSLASSALSSATSYMPACLVDSSSSTHFGRVVSGAAKVTLQQQSNRKSNNNHELHERDWSRPVPLRASNSKSVAWCTCTMSQTKGSSSVSCSHTNTTCSENSS